MKQVFHRVPPGSSNSTPQCVYAVKHMRLHKLVALFTLVLLVLPATTIAAAQGLTAGTDDPAYEPGEKVEISGTAYALANVTITINFGSELLFELEVTADEDGEFAESVKLEKDAASGTYTVTVSVDAETVQAEFTVLEPEYESEEEELVENLISQAEELHDDVEEAFEELKDEEIDVPSDAQENYDLGVAALDDAEALLEEGSLTEASEKAFEALQHFGVAFEQVQGLIPEEPPEEEKKKEDAVESVIGLEVAIERAIEYMKRLDEAADRLEEERHDVSAIKRNLREADTHLEQALAYLEAGGVSSAARGLAAARGILGRTNGLMNGTIKANKEKMAERFLQQAQARFRSINGSIYKLQSRLEEKNANMVRASLSVAERKLDRLRERFGEDELDDLLDELEDAIDEMDDELDLLNGESTSKTLKDMNRVEAQIRVLKKTEERLRRMGEENPEILEKLNASEALLDEIQLQLEAGDLEAINDLIEEVEKSFEEARDEIRESKISEIKERAHKKPEDTLGASEDDDDDETDEDEEDVDDETEELVDEIRDLERKIVDIENKTRRLAAAGVNTSDVEALMDGVRDLLSEATKLVSEDPEAAEDLMDAVEEAVDDVDDLLEELVETLEAPTESGEEEEPERPKGETRGANQTTG